MRITDYTKFFTQVSLARKPSPIRALQPLLVIPGMISLGGGMPNPETFPIAKASLTLKDGTTLELSPEKMKLSLQYSETAGLKGLVKWLSDFQQKIHRPPLGMSANSLLVSPGSQDVLSKAFEMLIERGDNVLVESPTYSGALAALNPLGCNLIGIETDRNGLIPESLESRLEDVKKNLQKYGNGKPPKVLYTIPTGSNPTGGSLTLDRKRAVYSIAQKNNLIILEDDPYYYLQFGEKTPSLLSLDTDGRVLRFDSFSKIISSGLRVGFATGPNPLIERLNLHGQISFLHASGLSQVVLLEILENMGYDGFLKHTDYVSGFYKKRMETFAESAKKHLTGLAEWHNPSAGMFFWIKLKGIEDSFPLIQEKAVEQKVLYVPGSSFDPKGNKSSYVRAAFSVATPEQMDEGLRRLAVLLKQYAKN